jgi:hypothetical protein
MGRKQKEPRREPQKNGDENTISFLTKNATCKARVQDRIVQTQWIMDEGHKEDWQPVS